MYSEDILKEVGLTRAMVEHLTRHMKPDFNPKMHSEDPGKFMYRWLSKWRYCWIKDMDIMLGTGVNCRTAIEAWNAKFPEKAIEREIIDWGSSQAEAIKLANQGEQ